MAPSTLTYNMPLHAMVSVWSTSTPAGHQAWMPRAFRTQQRHMCGKEGDVYCQEEVPISERQPFLRANWEELQEFKVSLPPKKRFRTNHFWRYQIWRESTKIFPATTVCWNWWGVSRTCSDGKHNALVDCPLFPAHHMETFEQKMIIFIEISPKLICEDASLANSGLVSKGFQMSRN